MSELLHFAEHRLQEISLLIMAIVYTLRIRWLLHFKSGRERQAQTGALETSPQKGIAYSLFNIAMPWAMESTRRKKLFYNSVCFVSFRCNNSNIAFIYYSLLSVTF